MADSYVGSGYDQFIGTRPSQSNPKVIEYYNTQNSGQPGFSNPQDLANFANTIGGRNDVTAANVFDVVKGGFTPRAQALDQIKTQLNDYQNNTFNAPDPTSQRQSSSITGSIGSEQSNYNTYFSEYNDLRKKLETLDAPNYQQAYNDLTTQQGIPQINTDLANSQKSIRELPYVNRQNFGNAGVATEGQLSADTQQKGIPLEIQQANLIDRLKLAQDFVNNSLKFKEMDANASRQSLSDAMNTVLQTINLSRTHLNDLLTQQKEQQDQQQKAQQFAYDNRISQPFYDVGGTVFRTSDRAPAHTPQEYVAMGGKGDYSDVQKLNKLVTPIEVNPGNTLVDPTTGKPLYQAPFTPSKYTSGSAGGSSSSSSSSSGSGSSNTKYTATSATSEIMGEWKKGYLQGNGTISSSDYKKAKQWWIDHAKLSAASFDRQFGYLIDKSGKSWKSDYGYGSN